MSDDIFIIRTVFEDVVDGSRTPGVRVYDSYTNSFIQWDFTPKDDMDLFFKVRDHADEAITSLLEYVFEQGKSIYIDQRLVRFDEIQRAMMEDYEPPDVQ